MAKKIDPFSDCELIPDFASMTLEFTNGKPIGETARIDLMKENFSWKRTFLNVWTGWPNDGKSTFFMFMALMKSSLDGWKWCIWPPEMINSRKTESGQIVLSASDIYDELVFMMTGKNPYKHFQDKYNIPQMKYEEYIEAISKVSDWFKIVHPKERKYTDLIDTFRYFHEVHGCDGFLIDPFKNLDQSDNDNRTDLYLDKVFGACKEFAIETNSSFNFIAHPKSQVEPKNQDGSYKICTQHMLAGGAAWNNNMDGIYSIYRPLRHSNPIDSQVHFFNLKQRKQQLTGRVGRVEGINFDFFTNRYYFNNVCPIDGSSKNFEVKKQEPKGKGWGKTAKKNDAPPIVFQPEYLNFNEPKKQLDPDETPF